MIKILITGANSYIGTCVESYLSQWPEKYQIDTVDLHDPNWRSRDFSGYDTVFHVAGIAHSDTGRVSKERKDFYYEINTDLAVQTAQKAKQSGVGQFIFMSSIIVYGNSAPMGKDKLITKDTPVCPANFYGNSKAKAEEGILLLDDASFKVVILRAPMVYGKHSKGNYRLMAKLAGKLPVFPYVQNRRSMLYIGNLSEFVRLMIDNREQGIFWPQNREYTSTALMLQQIAAAHGKKLVLLKGFSWALRLLGCFTGLVTKAFGSLCYDQSMSEYKTDYRLFTLEQSILETEQ